jgi:two-component system, OmpR family, phosphate regulon sensor histidine kinase PhoR
MTNISSKIAAGSYDRRIILKSRDEVGQLAETFNNMAEKLEITINDLYDKKNKLEAILKSMQSGVIAVDRSGKIILVNPIAINMFGFDKGIVGKHILEAIRNIELEDIIIKQQDENKEIVLNYPEKRVLRVKAAPIIDNDKTHKKLGVVVVMQDITEIKQLEKIRTDFVANVSHELKTPLTSIKGFTETLKNGAINDVITREKFLDIINVEADRLTRLINDILIISELENKRQNILFEKINVNDALEEIEDMMFNLAKLKNISLTFNKNNDIPDIAGNHDKVKQLFINLIDNAIKYTHEGGKVDVKVYYINGKVSIEVADTGIGISKEHISRLFERFYRVDKGRSRAMGGTGLGLAIVKHIVATMNGEIKVNSELGKGTTFIVILPKV